MAVHGFGALILFTQKLDQVVQFYSAMGLQFEEEEHEDGPRHLACQFGDTHFAIYFASEEGDAPKKLQGGASQLGFVVDNVFNIFNQWKDMGAKVIWEPEEAPWGLTAQVYDPDGRPVEIFEPNLG